MKHLVRVPSLAILLAVVLATAGFGQVLPVSLGVNREARDLPAGSRRSVVVLPNGGFATTWSRSLDLHSSDVYLQFVRADGTLVFKSPGRAVASSPALEWSALLVAHAREGALVAWARIDPRRARYIQLILQWIDGHGHPRWGAGVAAEPSARGEFQGRPALLASPDGGAFICFVHTTYPGTIINDIDCQRFSPKGERLWGKYGVRVFSVEGDTEAPHLVADGAGGLLVFWRAGARAGGRDPSGSIRRQRLGPDGRPFWGGGVEGRIFHPTRRAASAYPHDIGVIPDGSGGALVAFDDLARDEDNGDLDVTVLRVSGAGEKLWGDGIAAVAGPESQSLDALVPGPDGGFFVGAYSPPIRQVEFHRFTADGTALWPADGVPLVDPAAASPGEVNWETAASFSGNELRVAWEHIGNSASGDIRFGILDLAGNRLIGPAGATLTEQPGLNKLTGLAFDPESGASFVSWQHLRPAGGSEILGAIYASQ